ncbi:MAG: SpoIVB peptidase S55 domain-containing protein [Verrucomicrobiia bacterium]
MIKIFSLILFFLSAVCISRAEEIFPASQIKAGMKGTTYTVLQGTNVVPLETEILGVSEDYLGPGKDLIIAKLVDEKTKLTGAVHGMSGSPLYIDGKLVGALSRRIAMFEKDGHCGFTPIADMLTINQKAKNVKIASHPKRFFPGYSWLQNDEKSGWLSVPLSMSGVSGYAKKIIDKIWEGSGFFMASGGGGRGQSQPGAELLPGAPVSVALLTGDLHMAGTGTVTWRQGDQLLAFGHPMFGWGDVELPLCEAEIVSTVPSYEMPYKLANVRRTVGTLTQDRLSAVGGVVGPMPTLPRYRVTVQWENQQSKVYEGNFVSHELLTPVILASLVGSVLLENDEASAKWSVALKGQLALKGHEPLNFDAFSSGNERDVMGLIFGVAQRG